MEKVDGKPQRLPYGFHGVAAAAKALAISPNRLVALIKAGDVTPLKPPAPAPGRGRPAQILRYADVVDAAGLAPRRFVLFDGLEWCWLCENCIAACSGCRRAWEWCGSCRPCTQSRACQSCGRRGIPTSILDRPEPGDVWYCQTCTTDAGWLRGEPSAVILAARANELARQIAAAGVSDGEQLDKFPGA